MAATLAPAEHLPIDRIGRSRNEGVEMGIMQIKRTTATALAGALLAASAGAPAALGMPIDLRGEASRSVDPAPPPSLMALSAAEEYADLRGEAAASHDDPIEIGSPAAAEPVTPDGFDVPSAAIGAAGTGLIVVVLAAGGLVWRRQDVHRQRAASA